LRAAPDPDRLAALLADRDTYPDERLPSTGVPIELERTLSALCIVSPMYGTVCHSVLSLTDQRLHFAEITTNPTAEPARVEVSFPLVHVESR
jgi:uncharacterized protein with NRDE domain